jgi:competence protein ComEA
MNGPRACLCVLAVATALALPACGLLGRGGGAQRSAAVDLNTASLRAVERLPGITPRMAREIVEGRPYDTPDDLVRRRILTDREYGRIADMVVTGGG